MTAPERNTTHPDPTRMPTTTTDYAADSQTDRIVAAAHAAADDMPPMSDDLKRRVADLLTPTTRKAAS